MIINLNKLSFNILQLNFENKENKTPIVFLHGFTGNVNDWDFVIKNLPESFYALAIDLIGHGKTSSPNNIKDYTLSSQLHYLNEIFSKLKINKPVLVGYSMGGRLALSYAVENKNNIKALVLESTSFGIKNKTGQNERISIDKKRVEQINNYSLKDFFDYWYNMHLFNSLNNNPNISIEKIKKERVITNNKIGLMNSLLGFSTGTMGNYFERIKEFNNKVLLITGSLDKKFSQIAKEALNFFPNAEHELVDNCGHNVHLEKPEEFLKFLNNFLLNI